MFVFQRCNSLDYFLQSSKGSTPSFFSFYYVYACFYACMCITCVQYPQGPEEGVRIPGTGITGAVGARN